MTPHGEHNLGMHRTYPRTYCPECMGTVGEAAMPAKRTRTLVAKQPDAIGGLVSVTMTSAEPNETREAWLIRATAAMRPWFPADFPVPAVRVSVGFPSGKGSSKLIGQCWYTTADKVPALFVSPELTMPLLTLLHEMVHAATPRAGHKGAFVKVARALGFEKPWTSSGHQVAELTERVNALYAELGDFPHAKVNKSDALRGPVQSTRMLAVRCQDCGCLIRMTRKWLDDAGAPTCACGGMMQEDAA